MPFIQETVIDFLGKNIVFPLELVDGKPEIKSGLPLIETNLRTILSWKIGNRPLLCEFGSNVQTILEEPNTEVLERVLEAYIRDGIAKWETRIKFIGVDIERPTSTSMNMVVVYQVVNSPNIESFIYPLYENLNY